MSHTICHLGLRLVAGMTASSPPLICKRMLQATLLLLVLVFLSPQRSDAFVSNPLRTKGCSLPVSNEVVCFVSSSSSSSSRSRSRVRRSIGSGLGIRRTRLYAEGDEEDNEEQQEETIEELMKRAAAEQDEERQAKTKAELERKAKAKKEKEDRDYEKYWNRITEKPGIARPPFHLAKI